MQTCLPFMLLSSSIPLTFQSNVSDPAFSDLTAGRRPGSSLSDHRASISTQPSRNSTPVPLYRRFSTYEQRRAHSSPPEYLPTVGTPAPRRQLSGRMRKTMSAPSSFDLPTMHESWAGARETGKGRGKRRVSDPVKTSASMIDFEEVDVEDRRSSAPPLARSSYSLPSPRHSIDSSRLSTSSTLTPSLPSPGLNPESRASLSPPSPSLQTLEEDEEFETPQPSVLSVDSSISWQPSSPSLHISIPEEIERPTSEPKSTRDISRPSSSKSVSTNEQATPPRRPSKKVSFSKSADEIISTPEDILEDSAALRRQPSWSGFLLISAAPIAARPTLKRRTSMPSVRGQAAGRSILRRTSSFQNNSPSEAETPSPITKIERNRNPRSRSRSRSNSGSRHNPRTTSPSPMPPLPESSSEPDIHITQYLDAERPPPSSDTSSLTSKSSKSSLSSYKSKDEENPDFLPPTSAQRNNAQSTTVPPPQPRKPEPAFSIEKRVARHWSMRGPGNWVRRSGILVRVGDEHGDGGDVPPVPALPAGMRC